MSKLHISPDLQLPLDWMSMATIVYGARGAGKTTFGSVVAEEVHKQRQRFCVVDIKGDWWGLKSSADGQRDGIPVVIFGGDHADLPLEPTAGAFIGQLVAGLEQSVILDLEHLSKGKQIAFLTEFFLALYHHNRMPLLVLADEMQRYAPQMARGDDLGVAKCLGAVEDVVKLGRKHGLGIIGFTQRGSGLNKEVSELGDLLVAFRTPGPLDQGRIREWLNANVTAEEGQFVMKNIAGLETGTAIFASGHPDLKVFKIAAIRHRETFDSSATPRIGHRKVAPKKLAAVDIEALKGQMAGAIERAKADDPRELRKRIQELERQLVQSTKHNSQPQIREVEKIVEVPVRDPRLAMEIQRSVENWMQHHSKEITEDLARMLRGVDDIVAKAVEQFPALLKGRAAPLPVSHSDSNDERSPRRASPPPARPVPSAERDTGIYRTNAGTNGGGPKLGLGERKVLAVLAQRPDGRAQKDVAFLAGYSAKASTLGVILSNLRRGGLVEPGQPVRATDAGLVAAGGVAELPSGPELLEHWMRHPRIGEGERKVLRALIEAYPEALSHQELCERTGYSPDASTMGVILSKLRKLGLVESGARRVPDSFMEAIA